ncbi:hypothetical protein F5146DRAFT_317808 [Armillaria mellea]|nr:hypothetical protein F5146DRAFT_317808 [Armillaria mellea]
MKMYGFKDVNILDSYVFRRLSTSAFSQMEIMSRAAQCTAPGIAGTCMGPKARRQKQPSFVTCYTGNNQHVFIMEILYTKECAWPGQFNQVIVALDLSCHCLSKTFAVPGATKKTAEVTKFGHSPSPLVPTMQMLPAGAGMVFLLGETLKVALSPHFPLNAGSRRMCLERRKSKYAKGSSSIRNVQVSEPHWNIYYKPSRSKRTKISRR